MQVTGRQEVLLISPDQAFDGMCPYPVQLLTSPDQAFDGMYPYPVHHMYDRFSMVNFEKPRLDIWPCFSTVRGQLLSPREILYIPPCWCAPGGLHAAVHRWHNIPAQCDCWAIKFIMQPDCSLQPIHPQLEMRWGCTFHADLLEGSLVAGLSMFSCWTRSTRHCKSTLPQDYALGLLPVSLSR